MAKKQNVTFSDIAKYTNFSKTTISRYFNNPDSLTLENQQIISDALIKLNYQENKVARILANGKTEFVGIIVPNLYLHYYSEILNQILLTYEEFGYKFLVFIGNENEEIERQYIRELMAYKIEGLIIANALVALSGAVMAQKNRVFEISMGTGAIVFGLAAVIIGTNIFKNRQKVNSSTAAIVGSIIYKACVALALSMGLVPQDLKLVTAALFLIILVLGNVRRKKVKFHA